MMPCRYCRCHCRARWEAQAEVLVAMNTSSIKRPSCPLAFSSISISSNTAPSCISGQLTTSSSSSGLRTAPAVLTAPACRRAEKEGVSDRFTSSHSGHSNPRQVKAQHPANGTVGVDRHRSRHQLPFAIGVAHFRVDGMRRNQHTTNPFFSLFVAYAAATPNSRGARTRPVRHLKVCCLARVDLRSR